METKNYIEILYARNMAGNIKIWRCEVKEKDNEAQLHISFGLHGSKLSTYITTVTEGKNIGKANETTPLEQAIKEAESMYNKKLKQGFKSLEMIMKLANKTAIDMTRIEFVEQYLPVHSTDENNNLKPMKAQKFSKNTMKYPVIGQPKINGFRCTIRLIETIEGEGLFAKEVKKIVILSKEGNEYILSHITSKFTEDMFFYNDIEIAFDGELYIPGMKLNMIKKHIPIKNKQGTISVPSNNPELVQFWSFDLAIPDMPQVLRLDIKNDLLVSFTKIDLNDEHLNNKDTIVNLGSEIILNDDNAKSYRDSCIDKKYEGAIYRDMDAEYKFGSKPSTMRKWKKWEDGEFEVLNIIEKNSNELVGGTRTYICFILRNDINNNTFEAVPEGDEQERLEYLNNKDKYIGKKATVKYYERSGVKAVPFHAIVITIRNGE